MRLPVLSFRWKILFAMAAVVVLATFTVLITTQRRVRANYDRMFRTQFERQLQFFVALQQADVDTVRHRCLEVVSSAAVVDVYRQSSPDAVALYREGEKQLRDVLSSGESGISGPATTGTGRPGRVGRVGFMRFLNAECIPFPPPERDRLRSASAAALPPRRLQRRLDRLREVLQQGEPQQVGYLALSREFGFEADPGGSGVVRLGGEANAEQPVLQKVIVTRIVDPDNGKTLGALVLGLPVPELIPEFPAAVNLAAQGIERPILDFQAVIVLDGELYGNPSKVTAENLADLSDALKGPLHEAGSIEGSFLCHVGQDLCRGYYRLLNPDSSFPPAHEVVLYSLEGMLRELRGLRYQILLGALGAVLIAAILSWVLSHGLSEPIQQLASATSQIREGNFDVRVPVRRSDELGRLAGSFNEMAEGLALKERYRTILNMVSDEQVAQRLLDGKVQLGGEVRKATVLFCDIRGFTALTQDMPPEEVIDMLNEHMTALTRVIKQHQGVLDKFVGDLLMAVFGAPFSRPDDAVQAVRCALRLIEERHRLNRSSRFRLEIGIGVATGDVLAGCMGSADRLNYTVIGQRVNLGSRLCDAAGPGEIWVDGATAQELEGILAVDPLPPQDLPGFSEPVPVFRMRRGA